LSLVKPPWGRITAIDRTGGHVDDPNGPTPEAVRATLPA
jgi:hypothetical protein